MTTEVPAGWFGPFRPLERIARGGVGEVWRAEHAELGLAVAVKTVPAASRLAFDGEVANVATLTHPGIVRIVDRGFSHAGTPWLAMELAQTTLARRPPADLASLEDALLQVLDALGHAHGRGVLHLDLKPSNLLWQGDRVLLADFGISTVLHDPRASGWGTPAFAAPEQLAGRWRELGPWTDLYALGATARILAGPVHPALAPWVRRATQPLPDARFQSAAEAREALLALDTRGPVSPIEVVDPTVPGAVSGEVAPTTWRPRAWWPRRLPPLPEPSTPRRQPAGAGAAIFGQRTVPLVGRHPERAAAWSSLGEVLAARTPRWVHLLGPSGVGKSRLAEWLVTEAHAATGCRIWRARHAVDGPEGLREAARDALGTRGLTARDLGDRLRAVVGDIPALADWLDERPVATRDAAAALATALRVAEPVVLWIDDAQDADPELLTALADALSGAVLVVTTCRTDVLEDRARGHLEALAGERITLGPLARESLCSMLAGLLGLDPLCATTIADRAEGNAMVAAQLVAGAIASGQLRPSPSGLRADVEELRLPASATELWSHRLAQVGGPDRGALELAAILGPCFDAAWRRGVDGVDELVARALRAQVWCVEDGELRWTHELAREAALQSAEAEGRLAELHRRATCCVDAELEPARAGRHHVGAGDPETGATLLLRALRQAVARGQWLSVDRADRDLRRALARMDGEGRIEVDRLLERARMAANRWRSDEAWSHLESIRERVLREGDVDQRGLFHWLCGQTLLVEHRPLDALAQYQRAEALHGADPGRRARLMRAQARCLRLAGDVDGALDRLREALVVAETLTDDPVSADLTLTLAVTLHTAGQFEEALPAYVQAIDAYGEGYAGARGELWTNLGDLHRHRGDPEAARSAYDRARPLVEATGSATDSLELGVALLDMDGAPDRAREALQRIGARAAGTAQAGLAHFFALQLSPSPEAWDACWTSGRRQLPDLFADIDLADALDRALRHAETSGWTERARRAREARDEVRRKLGRPVTTDDVA